MRIQVEWYEVVAHVAEIDVDDDDIARYGDTDDDDVVRDYVDCEINLGSLDPDTDRDGCQERELVKVEVL